MAYFRKVKANNKQGYKWVCVLEAPSDPVTGKRRQISRRGDSKKEALARAEEALKKLTEDGIDESVARNLSFEQVAWEWLDVYRRGDVKPNTIRVRTNEIKVLLRYIAKISIAKITPRMHQKILNDLHDKDYAKTTISGVQTTAGMIYKYALQQKMRKDNPASGAKIPEKVLTVEDIEKNSIEETYMEKEELEEFLKVVNEHGLPLDKEWFYLLAFSGMRSGEMLALKWTDINFETNEIRITKTMYNPTENMRKYQLTTPKTKASIRTIYIDDSVIALLKAHKAKQAKIKMVNRRIPDGRGGTIENPDYHDADFVFAHANGFPYNQVNVNQRMQRLMKKTKIKKHLTPHSFRHTHISMLTEAGVDLATIMKRVGHEDQETTMKIYTHVTEKMKKDANEKIKIHFSHILNLANPQEM